MKQDNEQKVGTIKENDFTAVLVRKSEIEAVRKSGLKVTDVISTFNNVTTSNDIIEEITQFGNTLMRGVQTFSDIKGNLVIELKMGRGRGIGILETTVLCAQRFPWILFVLYIFSLNLLQPSFFSA